jgi:preprotein translocase SecE subunit
MEQVEPVAPRPRGKLSRAIVTGRDFIVEVRAELRKVTWPTRTELVDATRRVLIMTVALGTAIGILDVILQKIFVDGVAALAR